LFDQIAPAGISVSEIDTVKFSYDLGVPDNTKINEKLIAIMKLIKSINDGIVVTNSIEEELHSMITTCLLLREIEQCLKK
jgi:hypothetical protein